MQTNVLESVIDWDEDKTLSIVLQGAIFSSNLIEAAVHCQHWRDLFKNAEIIFSISVSDCLVKVASQENSERFELAEAFESNGQLQVALKTLYLCCDEISLSEGALPLPPIKTFLQQSNNANLQIAAARNGLVRATGRYVLRIRSDIVFWNRQFLDQFVEGMRLPRGRTAVLQQRVLISWLFTLNPYTHERLPLHFSDWFHFGLTEDVKALWDVPLITFADSVYYRTHTASPRSNYEERTIVPRLAVEQHVMYNAFKRHFPELHLRFHNDDTSLVLANEILIDNFNICDIISAGMIFKKYDEALRQDFNNVICVNRADWISMTLSTSEPRDQILYDKLPIYRHRHAIQFPLHLTTNLMSTKTGMKGLGYIAARRENGVALFGPHMTLPPGRYKAIIHTPLLEGAGSVEVKATLDEGKNLLARIYIDHPSIVDSEIEMAFDILHKAGEKFEIVCETHAIEEFVITGVTIHEREDDPDLRLYRSFRPGRDGLNTRIEQSASTVLRTEAKQGVLCFGPYVKLEPGRYRVTWKLKYNRAFGRSRFDVACDSSKTVIVSNKRSFFNKNATEVACDFHLTTETDDVEFRVVVDKHADFEIQEIVVATL